MIESSENEPVEPTEPAESIVPEPDVKFVVKPEANQGKQLSIIPCTIKFVGYCWVTVILH